MRAAAGVDVHFDLASPWTYLVAERAERMLPALRWRPVLAAVGSPVEETAVERRAAELAMPLVWPDARWGGGRPAMRVAHFAAAHDRAGSFVIAVGRLMYCGGFDLDDLDVLADASAAAHLDVDAALHAAGETWRDEDLLRDGRCLAARGASELPAFDVGTTLLCGEHALPAVAAAARQQGLVTTA